MIEGAKAAYDATRVAIGCENNLVLLLNLQERTLEGVVQAGGMFPGGGGSAGAGGNLDPLQPLPPAPPPPPDAGSGDATRRRSRPRPHSPDRRGIRAQFRGRCWRSARF